MFSVGQTQYAAHVNLMPCVIIGNAKDVLVRGKGQELRARIVRIRPDVMHSITIGDGGAEIVYLDGLQTPAGLADFSQLPQSFGGLAAALKAQDRLAIRNFRQQLSENAVEPDIEVLRIVEALYCAPMERLTQIALAQRLGLERTQALKHFKANTGQTFRRFKKWAASIATIQSVLQGQNIGSAGIDSGFSDAAHVARTAKEIFGATPTYAMGPLKSFTSV